MISGMRTDRLPDVGHILRKEDIPMKRFLRDVLAAFVAAVLAAVVVRLLNL